MNARKQLQRDLALVVDQLRRVDGTSASADAADGTLGTAGFDEVDFVQAEQRREIGLLTRERLVERAQRLTAALARVDDGTYGSCAECSDPIAPARLRALPEADACVTCQEGRERDLQLRRRAA